MLCRKCASWVDDKWEYCPKCGERVGYGQREIVKSLEEFNKEMNRMMKELEKEFSIDLRLFKDNPAGFTISISQPSRKPRRTESRQKKTMHVPPGFLKTKHTEEPDATVRNTGNGFLVEMKLPKVRSEKDIYVRKLPSSLEISAFGGDKRYFKIIPIPEGMSIVNKQFIGNKLVLQLA
jgi:HSP20 family molecular chaperone IbpA